MDDGAIQQFIQLTGASPETANFYLESSNGSVEAAVDAFWEGGGAQPTDAVGPNPVAAASPAPPRVHHAPPIQPPAHNAPAAAAPSGRRKAKAAAPPKGIRSLADLGQSDDDEDSDEGNEYYAGGEKSGQVVRGHPKGEGGGDEVEGLFDRARQAGARQGTSNDLPGGSKAAAGNPAAFTGSSRTLAGGSSGEPASSAASPSAAPGQTPGEHVITFWRNNIFTVDDGEPRSITAPVNREFLDAVVRGECPRELEAASQGAPVNVSLLRRNEDYVPPQKPRNVSFSGTGRTLAGSSGSANTNTATGPVPPSPNPSTAISTSWEGVDDQQPTTSLQLRLSDGSRMVARFNLTHTVADIRRFITASRPDIQGPTRLATAFPAAALDDETATIAAAGLQNATVVQKAG